MRISKPWIDFEREILNVPVDCRDEILLSAAVKKRMEIQEQEDVDLDDRFVRNLVVQAKKKQYSPDQQMKYIKRYTLPEDEYPQSPSKNKSTTLV